MAAFPAAKLGALILKQVSKPIANTCKHYALNSPTFKKYICMPPAQFYHWAEVQMKMWVLNLGKPVNIPVLNEKQAIELGANLLGEGVIFTIAALIMINEYNRSSVKEYKKELARNAEKERLENKIQELYFTTEKQATQIRELVRLIHDLDARVVQVPWKTSKIPLESSELPPPDDPPPPSHSSSSNSKLSSNSTSDLNADSESERGATSLVGCAYHFVDFDLFPESERSTSIVNIALDHLYHNVYGISLAA